eukprot:m51a1_g1865 hypothetical protein (308) ;mRNA; f:642973-644287
METLVSASLNGGASVPSCQIAVVVRSLTGLWSCGQPVVYPPKGEPGLLMAGHRWRLQLVPDRQSRCISLWLEYSHEDAGFTCHALSIATSTTAGRTLWEETWYGPSAWRSAGDQLGAPCAVRHDDIAACPDDALHVRIRVREPHDSRAALQPPPAVPDSSAEVCASLGALLREGWAADVSFVVGPSRRRFAAHRAVLCARSPALRALLCAPGAAAEELREEEAGEEAFAAFLGLLYTGRLPAGLGEGDAQSALALARKYQLPLSSAGSASQDPEDACQAGLLDAEDVERPLGDKQLAQQSGAGDANQ